jgi:hypothetical protein
VAGGLLALYGLVAVTFNVIMGSLRQQLIPDRLLGRVISAFRLFSYGSVPLGALFGVQWPAGSGCRRHSWSPVWRFRSWHCSPCRSSTAAPSSKPLRQWRRRAPSSPATGSLSRPVCWSQ